VGPQEVHRVELGVPIPETWVRITAKDPLVMDTVRDITHGIIIITTIIIDPNIPFIGFVKVSDFQTTRPCGEP